MGLCFGPVPGLQWGGAGQKRVGGPAVKGWGFSRTPGGLYTGWGLHRQDGRPQGGLDVGKLLAWMGTWDIGPSCQHVRGLVRAAWPVAERGQVGLGEGSGLSGPGASQGQAKGTDVVRASGPGPTHSAPAGPTLCVSVHHWRPGPRPSSC